ncbi:MAG: carboxymuconolactone decarboxylase family protein [Burkholderiaceae bacterium]
MQEPDHYAAVPQLARLRKDVLYQDVWKQPELSSRDRCLVTCAILGALGKNAELEFHMGKAVENGVTPDELRGLVVQLAFYAGWPCGVSSAKAGLAVFRADQASKVDPGGR